VGTSVSQTSPSTPIWQATQATYYRPDIPVERTVQELWRAADSQTDENLARDISAPIVAECLRVTMMASSRMEAVRNVAQAVVASGESTLATEIARRAATKSFSGGGGGSATSFAVALFVEAGDYLASRDLPGFVGVSEKLPKVSDLVAMKKRIRARIADIVQEVELPEGENVVEVWPDYVGRVVETLKGRAA
jgi:hypothetical protein